MSSTLPAQGAELYPAFLKLAGRKVVIVGGGPVAAAKLKALRSTGARLVVVAPSIVPEIEDLCGFRLPPSHEASADRRSLGGGGQAEDLSVPDPPPSRSALRRGSPKLAAHHAANEGGRAPIPEIVQRSFVPADLDDAWFVVAAATPEVNRAVAAAAEARRLFVNAVDDPANATAYLGGVLRRSGVTIAVSTGGDAPALAGLLREALELLLPEDLDRWMDESRRQRRLWKTGGVPMPARRPLLLNALNSLYGRSTNQEARP